MKKFLSICLVLVSVLSLAGCTMPRRNYASEKLTEVCDPDIANVIIGNLPEAVRYTTGGKTYVTDDEELIKDLLKNLNKLQIGALDLAIVDPEVERITFCGVMRDSNGLPENLYIELHDGHLFFNGTYYGCSDSSKFREALTAISENGTSTTYSLEVEKEVANLYGYWLGDTSDISFAQDVDGLYHFRINDEIDSTNIFVTSVATSGTSYTIHGIIDGGQDYNATVSVSGDTLEYEGQTFNRAMLE